MRHFRSMLTLAAAAAVLATAPYAAGAANNARNDEDRLVCKSKPKTGTRFRTKTCHSRADWDKIAEENKRMADEMINRRMIDDRRGN